MFYKMLEHPEIAHIERTGYPSYMQPNRDLDVDDDEEDWDDDEEDWDDDEEDWDDEEWE